MVAGGRRQPTTASVGSARMPASCVSCAQRLETNSQLFGQGLGLLPGREVSALGEPVEVDEIGIRLLRPAPRRLEQVIREGARRHGDLHALRPKEAELV